MNKKYQMCNGNKEIEIAEWESVIHEENEEPEVISYSITFYDLTPKY